MSCSPSGGPDAALSSSEQVATLQKDLQAQLGRAGEQLTTTPLIGLQAGELLFLPLSPPTGPTHRRHVPPPPKSPAGRRTQSLTTKPRPSQHHNPSCQPPCLPYIPTHFKKGNAKIILQKKAQIERENFPHYSENSHEPKLGDSVQFKSETNSR